MPQLSSQLFITNFSGSLLGQFKADSIIYKNSDFQLKIDQLQFKWHPLKLIFKVFAVDMLKAKKITLTQHVHRIEKPSSYSRDNITGLPRIQLNQLQIDELVYQREKKTLVDIKNIQLSNKQQKLPLNLKAQANFIKPITGTVDIKVNGKPADYHFGLNLDFPALMWHINGKGDRQKIDFVTSSGKLSDGKLDLSGQLTWMPQLQITIKGHLNHLNLNGFNLYFPFIKNAELEFHYADNQLNWNLPQLNSNYPEKQTMHWHAKGNFNFQTQQGHAKIQLQAPHNHLDFNLSLQKSIQADWNFALQQLHQILPYAEGAIKSEGKMLWPRYLWPLAEDHYQLQTHAQISGLKLLNTKVQQADIHLNVDSQNPHPAEIHVTANQIALWDWHLPQLIFHTQTHFNQPAFQLKLNSTNWNAAIHGHGTYQKQAWEGKIQDWILHIKNYGDWKNQAVFPLKIGANQLQIGTFCLVHQTSQLCSEWNWQKDQMNFQSRLNALPLMPLLRALKSPFILDSNLSFSANLNATANKQNGLLKLQLSPGKILLRNKMQHYVLPYTQAALSATLDPQGIKSEFHFKPESQPAIKINLDLPDYQIAEGLSDKQKILGKIVWQTTDLDFLPLLIPHLTEAKGKLSLNTHLSGNIGSPIIAGELNITNGSAYLAEQNITIAPIKIAIQGKQSQLSYQASANSGGGQIKIGGSSKLNTVFESQFHIKGSNFLASDTHTLQLRVSPDLTMNLDTEQVNITGNIFIPEALIAPVDFNDVVSLPDDVQIIRDQQQETETPWLTNLDVALMAGNHVNVNAMRLKGRITGKVQVKQVASKALTGEGVLNIVNGNYDLFGRKLILSQAQLLFNNSLITNPTLNIRAIQRIKTQATLQNFSQQVQIVGINIQGTAENPDISLFSQPAGLSQSDILSLIVIGQPTALAKGSETQLLFRAAQALTPAGTPMGNLQQQLQQTLGLSEISIKSLEQYDKSSNKVTNNTALVLGKYLSPRLYLNYSIGLIDPVNILRVRYYLNRKWAVQTETSVEGSGGDVFYSFER